MSSPSPNDPPLWERAARLVGLNPMQLRWRLRRWQKRAEENARSVENQSRWLRYDHKVCPRCHHVADKDATACPSCAAPIAGRAASLLARVFDRVLPRSASALTYLSALFCIAIYAAMLLRDGFEHLTAFSMRTLMAFGALWRPLVE